MENGKMKLSTAIREGAKLRPQGHYQFFSEDNHEQLCSCALGAAYEALKRTPATESHYVNYALIPKWFGGYDNSQQYPSAVNPVTLKVKSLWNTIIDLNDDQKWTREQIADWLEKQGF